MPPTLPNPIAWASKRATPKEQRRIRIQPLNTYLATKWNDEVQPLIRKLPASEVRADRKWEWLRSWRLGRWFDTVGVGNLGAASFWCITTPEATPDVRKRGCPVGMLYIVHRFRPSYTADRPAFVWLLTAAPDAAYAHYGIPPLSLGKILLDTAAQVSLAVEADGHTLLHADPLGGDALIRFYGSKCGMSQLPGDIKISVLRKNDGRYFEFAPSAAKAFAAAFDPDREQADLDR